MHNPSVMKHIFPIASAARSFGLGVMLAAQTNRAGPAGGDWPMYSLNLAGTRFSPLTEINAANVTRLAPAWSVRLTPPAGPARCPPPAHPAAARPGTLRRRPVEAAPAAIRRSTPIVIGGVMYLPARGNQVLALDADTGKEVWRHQLPPASRRPRAAWPTGPATVSLAPRILLTAGPRLCARRRNGHTRDGLRARRHRRDRRAVERRADDLQERRDPGRDDRRGRARLPGDTRAFDVRTGAKLWDFHTVPLPGRGRSQHVARQRMAGSIGRERVGVVHDARRGARHPLHAGRRSGGQLLGRRSSRQQPLRQLDRRGRCGDRQVPLALPDRASRSVGFGHAESAGARGHHAERPAGSRAGVGRQDRLHVHPRSRHRQADLRRRGAAGAEGQRARRVVFADAAVPGEAGAGRSCASTSTRSATWCGPRTPRRSTWPSVRRCGTRAAASTTPARSRRSAFTRKARRRRARSSFRAAPAA